LLLSGIKNKIYLTIRILSIKTSKTLSKKKKDLFTPFNPTEEQKED
jgi:hypothetical protein